MDRLKKRWGINSNWQLAVIFTVFAINGTLAVSVTNPVMDLIGVSKDTTHLLLYWLVRIIAITFFYQITLIIIGTLFGQRVFFWNFTKKMWRIS